MYIPGFGDVSTPQALSATLAGTPTPLRMPYEGVSQTPLSRMRTERARSGILGSLANPLQGQGVQGLRSRPDPRDMPDPGPQPSTAGVNQGPFRYDSVLPPLSPEAQAALLERRRAATRAEEQARARIDRQRQMAEGAAVQGRGEIARQQAEQTRAGLSELASRGVARSPMFVNPFQRGVARQAQERVGELEMGLSQTLENLQSALQAAENQRAAELARIETDILTARSNVPGLLGA